MTYTIRKQDTITRNYGVFWGVTLVEGGFRSRSMAEDVADWWQENHPEGPHVPMCVMCGENEVGTFQPHREFCGDMCADRAHEALEVEKFYAGWTEDDIVDFINQEVK